MANRYWRGGTGTWDTTTTTNWSTTSGGGGGASVPTIADAVIFDANSGTGTVTLTGALNCLSLNTTGSSAFTFASTGNITCSTEFTIVTNTTWSATGTITFTGAGTITTNGRTLACFVVVNSAGLTRTLGDALTISQAATFGLTAGTLNLNNFTLTTGAFDSSLTGIRSIAFGTGNITVNGSKVVSFNMSGSNFTYTGTPTVNISRANASATSITVSAFTITNALNFNITTGTYALTIATSSFFKSLNFTSFAGSWATSTNTATFYGDLTLVSGMTFTSGSGVWTFAATSGVQTIDGSTQLLNSITQNGVGGTVRIASGTTSLATARTYTLTNGTLDIGTNSATLSCGIFNSNNSNVRSIIFGTGNITVTGTGFPGFYMQTATNFTYTGTSAVYISNNTATATYIAFGGAGGTELNALNFYINTGTYAFSVAGSNKFRTIDFTGFAGSWSPGATSPTFYGDLKLVSGMTWTPNTLAFTFAATSGTQTVTSVGNSFARLTKNGVGGTLAFADAANITTTFTFNDGTLQLPTGATTTVTGFTIAGTNLKYLTSDISGTQATISQASGVVTATYLSIKDSNAIGGATWTATAASNVNAGNNTGWNFGVAPSNSNFFIMF